MAQKIALAADHGGLALKEHIKNYLQQQGYGVEDFGTHTLESCDYADYAKPACQAVQSGACSLGILFCATGVGISMAANKMRGIRACCCADCYSAEMTRRHNDANVLCLGGRVVGDGLAEKLVDTFLHNEFEGGRHKRRIDKIEELAGE